MARFCAGSGGGQTKEDLLGAGEGEPQKLVRNFRYQINKMLLKLRINFLFVKHKKHKIKLFRNKVSFTKPYFNYSSKIKM